MTVRKQIKSEIIKRMDTISDKMLLELLSFVKELEGKSKKERLLSFSGIWKDFDHEVLDDLTINLAEKRKNDWRK